jgi:hypothetical protein
MKHAFVTIAALNVALICGGGASAQLLPPGTSALSAPLPAPVPPPRIEVPVVPQLDAPLAQNYAPLPRRSFGDRVSTCLSDATASGLGPSESAAYSRACATR